MAIKSKQTTPERGSTPFRNSGQPPGFKATGRGFFNRVPHFPATDTNANASLTNNATSNRDLYKIYLFVNSIDTGWALAGKTSQTQKSRSFYPRNLSQNELTIEGSVANQYEYDRLVRFVLHSQNSQFSQANLDHGLTEDGNYPGVDFALMQPSISQINTFDLLRYSIVVTSIKAGAQRFVNAPTFTLTCKVIYDYRQGQTNLTQQLNRLVNLQQVFGDKISNPSLVTISAAQQEVNNH